MLCSIDEIRKQLDSQVYRKDIDDYSIEASQNLQLYEKQKHISAGNKPDDTDRENTRTHQVSVVHEIMGKNPLKAAFKQDTREFAIANADQTTYDDLVAQNVKQQVDLVIQAKERDILKIDQPLLRPE